MELERDELIERALQIALQAHTGQTRKGSNTPYVAHPVMVALKLAGYGFPQEIIAAALVHDVLEDTDFPEAELRAQLGDAVMQIVLTVTEDKTLPWEARKEKYLASVRVGSEEAKAVSLADKIHNAESIVRAHQTIGANVWNLFSRGKEKKLQFDRDSLQMMKDTWQNPMIAEYESLIEQMQKLS